MISSTTLFVYLDDILIFSPSLQEHWKHVWQVLQKPLENCLFIKGEKCEFHVDSISILGFIIERGEMRADPVKMEAVLDWPEPTDNYKDSWGLPISTDI